MNIEHIIELIEEYGQECKDYGHSEHAGELKDSIREAIEEYRNIQDELETLLGMTKS